MSIELVRKSITVYFRPKDLSVGFSSELLSKLEDKFGRINYHRQGWYYIGYSLTDYDISSGKNINLEDIDKIKDKVKSCCGNLEFEFEERDYGFHKPNLKPGESIVFTQDEINKLLGEL